MSGDPLVAVDTSFVIALLKGAVRSERRLKDVAFPVAVAGELLFGAMNALNAVETVAEVERLLESSTILACDGGTATEHARLRLRLKNAGTPLPENDIWIAASCLQHGLPLVTLDRHFERVDGLRVLAD